METSSAVAVFHAMLTALNAKRKEIGGRVAVILPSMREVCA